jgi:hypothetical protein
MAVLYVPWRVALWIGSFFVTIPAAQLGTRPTPQWRRLMAERAESVVYLVFVPFTHGMQQASSQEWRT